MCRHPASGGKSIAARLWVRHPKKMPERTALPAPVFVTEMVTEPPAETLMGALTQAPWLKSVEMFAVCGPDPSLMVIVSRRLVESQSRA